MILLFGMMLVFIMVGMELGTAMGLSGMVYILYHCWPVADSSLDHPSELHVRTGFLPALWRSHSSCWQGN